MGADVRDMPYEEARYLSDRLREAGMTVGVSRVPHPRLADVLETRIECRQGSDVQVLHCVPNPDKPGECRVFIRNATGWRRSLRLRRARFQAVVTEIIERRGGYWPYVRGPSGRPGE